MDLPVPKGAGRDQKGFHHPIQQLPTAPGKRRKRGIAVHSSCNDIPEGTGDHPGEACRKRRKSGGELGIFDSPMHPGVTRRPPERGEPVEAQGFRLVTLRSGLEPTSESLSGESIHIGEIGDVPGGLAGSDKGSTIPDAVPPFPASFPGRREQRDIPYREQADPERKGKRRQDAASSPRVEDMHSRGCGGVVTDIDREARIPGPDRDPSISGCPSCRMDAVSLERDGLPLLASFRGRGSSWHLPRHLSPRTESGVRACAAGEGGIILIFINRRIAGIFRPYFMGNPWEQPEGSRESLFSTEARPVPIGMLHLPVSAAGSPIPLRLNDRERSGA